jgi:hypothetical protein
VEVPSVTDQQKAEFLEEAPAPVVSDVRQKKYKTKRSIFESIKESGMFSSFVIKQVDELVGIDIGTTSIKICSLKSSKGVFSIQSIVKKTYEQELISDGHIVDIDFLSQELQGIFKDNNIKSKNVACALSSYSVISKR